MPIVLRTTDAEFDLQFQALLLTKREADQDVDDIVSQILSDVQTRGDKAVIELTSKFDQLDLTPETLALRSFFEKVLLALAYISSSL